MTEYFDRKRIDQRSASVGQLARARESVLSNGPGRGVRVVDVDNGTGVQVEVLLDRGMDLGRCSFRGVPIAFVTPSGVTHPAYYDPRGLNWLRTWGGGLLTGTGLRNVGVPQEADGPDDPMGLHGRLSHTPATLIGVDEKWEGDGYVIEVTGTVQEASFFGDNLVLRRTVRVESVTNTIRVLDTVTNNGPRRSPFMILYHINFGYPMLDDQTRIDCEAASVEPRDPEAAGHMDDWWVMGPPTAGFAERCYYPDLVERDGRAGMELHNPRLPFSVRLDWGKKELPLATVWKMLGTKEYALGLEPGNCHPGGRKLEQERGTLVELEPGESREMDVRLAFVDQGGTK